MAPLRVRWVDTKGFSLTEWITEDLQPVMTRRFPLEPADPEGQRSVVMKFVRAEQERDVIVYRELVE